MCWMLHSLSPDKEDYFVSLLTVVFLSTTMWVFPLPIPYGMHLVVPTHPYFFWVVCHPSRTFSLKELEQEPQNRLSSLPTTRPYPFLLLTHDPPLPVLAGYRLVMFGPCACTTSVYVQNLSTAYAFAMVWRLVCTSCHSSLTSYDVSFFWFPILYGLLPLGARLCLIVGFSSFSLLFYSFCSLTTIPTISLCRSYYDDIRPQLAGALWACCLFFSQWLNMVIKFILILFWAFFYYIAYRLLCPIYFFLDILGPFAFLGHPWPFFLILLSHGLLLTLLDFPDPITLSFIIRAYEFSINPFFLYLRYFGLIVARSYFSTSHTVHGFATSLFGLL